MTRSSDGREPVSTVGALRSRERVVDEVRRIFADPGELADRVGADLAGGQLESTAAGEPDGPFEEAARRERERVVGDGVDGLAKVADGRDDDLDADELLGLEAIVLLEGRPALLVQEGDFLAPPHGWERLTAEREAIREVIARSGRVELSGHLDYDWVGTASLVGPDVVMTNRHVAREFCARGRGRRGRDRWVFRPGMSSRVDFLRERGGSTSMAFEVTGVIGVHEERDLALLRVENASSDGLPLPGPLGVSAHEPYEVDDREVYVVGYPAWDGRRNEPETLRRIFADVYDVKRLQPGRTAGYSPEFSALRHDCSTLGGNSGSPVVDLTTHEVIGLHFGGRYGVGNYAVPMWQLATDPLLVQARVNFR